MAGIGELAVFVTANTKKAQTSLMKFRSGMKKTSKGAKTLAKSISILSGITAGLSFAGMAAGIKSAMEEMDGLAKTSDKLGIVPEKLAGIRHAAEQTGVAVNTADMAMQRMLRRISEASVGKGEARGALAELGLDAKLLNEQSPDVVLGKVAKEINKIENQSDKLRIAMKLFDSEGVAFVNTLKLGEQGLADMIAEAKDLGIAPTREELRRIEAANDAMDRAAKSIKGAFMSAATELAPAIEGAADSFSRKMTQVIKYWSEFLMDTDFSDNKIAIARSGAPQERKDAAAQANLAVKRFREMGMHEMADKAQAALDFQLGSWMNELGGMTFSDGRKEIETLAEQAAKTYDIWKKSQEAAAAAGEKKAKEDAAAAQSAADNASRWAAAIDSMTTAAGKFTSRITQISDTLISTSGIVGGRLAETLLRDVEPTRFDTATLQSAQAGTREEYAIRVNMNNEAIQIQAEQLQTQQAQLAEQQRAADATVEAAGFLGEIVGRGLADSASIIGI